MARSKTVLVETETPPAAAPSEPDAPATAPVVPPMPPADEKRADGAPIGAPPPPAEKGYHWSAEHSQWKRNRGRMPGSAAPRGDSAAKPPLTPGGEVPPVPPTREEKVRAHKARKAEMAALAETLFPFVKTGAHTTGVMFRRMGLDLEKLPVHAIKLDKDGSAKPWSTNAEDALSHNMSEIVAYFAPTLLDHPLASPIVSALMTSGAIVVAAADLRKAAEANERAANANERAQKGAQAAQETDAKSASIEVRVEGSTTPL